MVKMPRFTGLNFNILGIILLVLFPSVNCDLNSDLNSSKTPTPITSPNENYSPLFINGSRTLFPEEGNNGNFSLNYSEFLCVNPNFPNYEDGYANLLHCRREIIPFEKFKVIKSEVNDVPMEMYFINGKPYKLEEFCIIYSEEKDHLTFKICPNPEDEMKHPEIRDLDIKKPKKAESRNKEKVLMRKCCKTDEILSMKNKRVCIQRNHEEPRTWNPAIYSNSEEDFSKHAHLTNLTSNFDINYEIGFPNCTVVSELDNSKDIWFKVLKDGSVFVGLKFWFKAVWLPIESKNHGFCLEELEQGENRSLDSHAMYHKNQILLYCSIERFDQYLFHRKLFGTLCISAATIILFLLVIYLSIYDKQNLAGWTQFNMFTAVFFVFGMEGTRTLADYNGLLVQTTISCTIIAAIAQYFFFAMNTTWCVMNFDLFWTFWKLESNLKGTQGKLRRIVCYLTFSWALPLVLVVGAFGFSHASANQAKTQMEGIYSLAHRRCSSPIRELGFQTQGVMFLLNLVFFCCTAFLLWKHRRGITGTRRNSRSEKHTWRSVVLFAKLLIVMGVSSLSIPLNYFFGSDDPLNPFEVLFRCVHFIPCVAILFIFGFNEKNMRLIKQKYPNFGEFIGISVCTNRNPAGTTDTNPSPSAGPYSAEIKEIHCTNTQTQT